MEKYEYILLKWTDTEIGYMADIMDKKYKIWFSFYYETWDQQPRLFFHVNSLLFDNLEDRKAYCFSLDSLLKQIGFSCYEKSPSTKVPFKWELTRTTDIENMEEFLSLSKDLVYALNEWNF